MEPLSKIAVIRLVFHASVTQTAKCMYVTLTYNQKWANIAHFKYATGIIITMDGALYIRSASIYPQSLNHINITVMP